MTGFQERLVGIQERVAAAARASGREPRDVRILPVSKTHPISMIQAAMAAGVREFGENRPQDLAAKAQELGANLRRSGSGNTGVLAGLDGVSAQHGIGGRGADLGLAPRESETKPDVPRWVMIGNLQRNKAKLIVAYAAELQSLDSLRLAETLSRLLGEAGRELDVMVQVNISGEAVKHGVEPGVALDFAGRVAALPGLRLTGFMGVAAPLSVVGESGVHEAFARLRAIRDAAVVSIPEASGLSMGMSGDFEIAIAEGSTCVRLGSGLFGQRRAGVVAPADK
ncbi:YggS family pyridoxal phosphate enzyme [Mobiluncus mulieris]|uniref:Pyridoxal phosphate homeostasis protein n=1 Tax=Mobiluncus mulieris TaxID=2052 RepID=A0A7Y0UUU6_9ACTO|nr:YggS family pyridoxal phosphate enzyme [Mobiluncus mulieris]NMX04145.1 YggS family pyridoxal phosphate enzyme [Mobiluncus mulieris]